MVEVKSYDPNSLQPVVNSPQQTTVDPHSVYYVVLSYLVSPFFWALCIFLGYIIVAIFLLRRNFKTNPQFLTGQKATRVALAFAPLVAATVLVLWWWFAGWANYSF